MTAFVLVPEMHTGGWIWREVADRLRESGAEAHPATLTGTGDRRHLAGPGTDLETHIEDLVQLIDHLDAPEVVIVGHGYGIHPALGAADRRPERIARIVCLDSGMPQDGDPALKLLPGAQQTGQDRPLPVPGPGEWQRLGSTEGLTAPALERLTSLAAPQPAGTLTQPLRLTGAAAGLPTTGVFCTANGSSIAVVEALLGLGDPRLRELVDPRVTFFELDTGHWPMLSAPDQLAGVLLRAAAGEGHRLAPPEQPAHLRPFLLDVAPRPRERIGRVDLHLPEQPGQPRQPEQPEQPEQPGQPGQPGQADGPRPAVVLVHGGPVPAEARPTPRDWPGLVGYAQYLAGLGVVGVTLDHRLHDLADYPRAAADVAEAVDLVRADPRVDGDRIALWFLSAGGLLAADWLAAPPPWLRCLAVTYPILAPLPNWPLTGSRFRPAATVGGAGRLPIVLTRVGLERPEIAATVEEFLTAAKDHEGPVEIVDVPHGRHGFETVDHTDEARRAVEHAAHSVLRHLTA